MLRLCGFARGLRGFALLLAHTAFDPRCNQRGDAPGSTESFRVFERTLAQGEELAAILRLDEKTPLPEEVKITGLLNDRRFERTIKVRNVVGNAGYLPRTWANKKRLAKLKKPKPRPAR